MRVCSLSYPACRAHATYYIVICCPSGFTMFFTHYLINGKILEKKILLNVKSVLSPQLLYEIFLIVRKVQRHTIINTHRS